LEDKQVEPAGIIKQIQAQTQRDLIARKAMAQATSDHVAELIARDAREAEPF
jgi:hypothetical protein